MKRNERYTAITDWFETNMPVPDTELRFDNEYQLIVSVILSAQCTDKRVNMVTPALFDAFPTPQALAQATFDDVYPYIRTVSYPNAKTRHLIGMAKMLVEEFNGQVPRDRALLQKLPGVGRKTANVVAAVAYDEPAIAVDTHVFRVSQRIGLVNRSKTPLEVELQLLKHVPENLRIRFHHWLILHGRYTCLARKPKCGECGIREACKYYENQQRKVPERAQ